MKNAQAARDLESRQSGANGNVPRPPAVRLPRELEWPKIENPYRHVDRRTPTEFRRTLEMQTNHVAASLRTSHLLTRAVEAKVNQAVIAEFVNPLRANGTIYAKAADHILEFCFPVIDSDAKATEVELWIPDNASSKSITEFWLEVWVSSDSCQQQRIKLKTNLSTSRW